MVVVSLPCLTGLHRVLRGANSSADAQPPLFRSVSLYTVELMGGVIHDVQCRPVPPIDAINI